MEKSFAAQQAVPEKVWQVLAFLIYHRARSVSREELSALLPDYEDESRDPLNALKTLIHRARAMLNELWPCAGKELLLYENGCYLWNTEIPMSVDVDDFDALCSADSTAVSTDEALRVLSLYRGDFLRDFSDLAWVIPTSVYYHNLYLQKAADVCAKLELLSRHEDVVTLCRAALSVEPYSEELYRCLLKNLVDAGSYQAAVQTYEKLRENLFDTFGVLPSEDIRAIWQEALSKVTERALSRDRAAADALAGLFPRRFTLRL